MGAQQRRLQVNLAAGNITKVKEAVFTALTLIKPGMIEEETVVAIRQLLMTKDEVLVFEKLSVEDKAELASVSRETYLLTLPIYLFIP